MNSHTRHGQVVLQAKRSHLADAADRLSAALAAVDSLLDDFSFGLDLSDRAILSVTPKAPDYSGVAAALAQVALAANQTADSAKRLADFGAELDSHIAGRRRSREAFHRAAAYTAARSTRMAALANAVESENHEQI